MPDVESAATPCYLAYATFKNAIQALALDGKMPRQVDHTILPTMGGSTRKMFLAALRFFELVGEGGAPTDRLVKLALASEPDWKDFMQVLLRDKYAELLEQLGNASPKSLRDSFVTKFNGIGSSLVEPSIRFLVSASRDSDIPVSAHLRQRKVRVSGSVRRRPAKIAKQNLIPEEVRAPTTNQSFRLALMEKFPSFDPNWAPEQQSAWFAAFERLMDVAGETNKSSEPAD